MAKLQEINPWGQFRPAFVPYSNLLTVILLKKLNISLQQIFIDINGLVKPKVPIESWAWGATAPHNFQDIDPRRTNIQKSLAK